MNKNWIKIYAENADRKSSNFNFWSGVKVWIERPHILNRKLLAVKILKSWKTNDCLDFKIFEKLENGEFCFEELCKYFEIVAGEEKSNYWQEISADKDDYNFIIIFRKLLPRNLDRFAEVSEVIVLDKIKGYAAFFPKKIDVQLSSITPAFPYKIAFSDTEVVLETCKSASDASIVDQLSEKWLKTSVLPKIINWCQNLPKKAILSSLTLVSPEQYNRNYHCLKYKYGKKFVENWPERSDPLKYVYEDIAIAAYLITLWEEERMISMASEKQSFIDLGCGNGLLVNILSSEGYHGIGIDVRKRKIWDLYGPETTLIEKAVEPSDHLLFPEHDWIIGNHSDELTPWIPVIAARSSYKMKVFLLPCCSYTFNGKYDRSNPGCTQYESYLAFIHDLCKAMGFKVQQDKLRIPSTKRICFVCMSRSYSIEQEKEIDNMRIEFISSNSKKPMKISTSLYISNCNDTGSLKNQMKGSKNDYWISDFKPREQYELVRNCSNFDKKFVEDTITTIFNILLKTENYVSVNHSTSNLWNSGGQMNIVDLIKLMDYSVLKQMKNHCGGFKTFLRNHKDIFQIEDCVVQIKSPCTDSKLHKPSKKTGKHQTMKRLPLHEKKCYFHFHHPQGCPLSANDCKFSHERD